MQVSALSLFALNIHKLEFVKFIAFLDMLLCFNDSPYLERNKLQNVKKNVFYFTEFCIFEALNRIFDINIKCTFSCSTTTDID